MLRVNANAGRAGLVALLFLLLLPMVASAQTDTPTPTPDACATDAAARWATVMAYESPTPTETPTTFADLAFTHVHLSPKPAVIGDAVELYLRIQNIGTEDVTTDFRVDFYDQMMHTEKITWTNGAAVNEEIALSGYYSPVHAPLGADGEMVIGLGYTPYGESNPSNNSYHLFFTVVSPTLTPTPMETPTPAPRFRCAITTTIDYSASHVALVYYTIEHRQPTGALYYAPVRLRLDGRLVHEQTFAFTAYNTHTYKSSWGIALADYQLINEHEFVLDIDEGAATCAVLIGEPAAIDEYYRGADGELWRYRREVSQGEDGLNITVLWTVCPVTVMLTVGAGLLVIWSTRRRT